MKCPEDIVSYKVICKKFPDSQVRFDTYDLALKWAKMEQPANRPYYIVKCVEKFEILDAVFAERREPMTREEAIITLTNTASLLRYGTRYMKLEHEKQFREAYEMAIKALEQPEQDCVLKQFGECSYDATGCSDCKIKVKIKTALSAQLERQRGAWIEYIPEHGKCPFCGNQVDLLGGKVNNFCGECGADMRGIKDGCKKIL